MRRVLIGAGGNAKSLAGSVDAYIDPSAQPWLSVPRIDESDLRPTDVIVLGIGGVTPEQLRKRLQIFDRLNAMVAEGDGVIVKTGAVVEPSAKIARAVLVNSGAIVCHDTRIGAGTHLAPGSVVLGGAEVGECCLVGAGAVVLPGADVPSDTLVKALTRWH